MSQSGFSTNGWSPDRALWCELVRVTNGLSWRNVDLDRSSRHRVPEHSGVYAICAESPLEAQMNFNACTILYAGQSKRCLRTRFLQHSQNPGRILQPFTSCFYPKVRFWFASVNDVSRIDEIEVLMIATFNPPCNSIQGPGASTIIAHIGTTKPIGHK